MHCPYCQNEVPDGSQICPVCHADIAAAARRASAAAGQGSASYAAQRSTGTQQGQGYSAAPQQPYTEQPQPTGGSYAPQGAQYPGQGYGSAQQQAQAPYGQYGGQAAPTQRFPQQAGAYGRSGAAPQANVNQPMGQAQYTAGQGQSNPNPMAQQGAQPAQQNLRPFDTKSMSSTPKWPIVVLVILVVIIIAAALLLVFHPWRSNSPTTTPAVTVTSNSGDASRAASAASVSSASSESSASAAEAASSAAPATSAVSTTSEEQAYQTLSAAYQAADGFNTSIGELATRFNSEDLLNAAETTRQSAIDSGNAVLTQIQGQIDALDAITLASDSAYTETLSNMQTIYQDLYHRMNTLVSALQATISGGGVEEANSIIAADNGSDGISIYKAEYDSLYPSSAPVAPAA